MIYPTASEILRCVDRTLLDASDIDIPRMAAKSALATSRHLVRHVELRMRIERSLLLADIGKTSELLGRIADYMQTTGEASAGAARDIRATLAQAPALVSGAADEMDRIVERALALRESVYAALARLQGYDAGTKEMARYREIRRLIREYIVFDIEQEAKMIGPAFVGQGPRR